MRRRSLKIIKKENGASAVEFAIILPILVILVFGIFEFGIAYNNWIALTHAAREGARIAAVGFIDENGLGAFNARVRDSAPSVEIQSIDVEGWDGIIGDPVTVTVTGSVLDIEIPFVGSWPVQLSSKAILRLEQHLQLP
jgi:Flp pilus assembly protein TadG